MNENTKTITLSSGRIATVRKPKVRDLLQAHRVVGFSGEPMAIAMGLVAQVTVVDAKTLLFEDVLELPAEDGLMLQNAVLEDEEGVNFTEAQGDEINVSRAPQQ